MSRKQSRTPTYETFMRYSWEIGNICYIHGWYMIYCTFVIPDHWATSYKHQCKSLRKQSKCKMSQNFGKSPKMTAMAVYGQSSIVSFSWYYAGCTLHMLSADSLALFKVHCVHFWASKSKLTNSESVVWVLLVGDHPWVGGFSSFQ